MVQKPISPTPDPVVQSRQLIDAGQRLAEYTEAPRPYYCRSCGRVSVGTAIPRGWYLLARARGNWDRHQRLGLFCSAACIGGQVPRLEGVEKSLGDQWDQVPSPYQS
jgi:hypothetical protein